MRILWNIFAFCAVALQIYAPKRKLSGSKEDHSFQPSVRLVHSPLCLKYFWHAQTLGACVRDVNDEAGTSFISISLQRSCYRGLDRASSIQYTVDRFTRTKANGGFDHNVWVFFFFLVCLFLHDTHDIWSLFQGVLFWIFGWSCDFLWSKADFTGHSAGLCKWL